MVVLAFNLWGVADYMGEVMVSMGYAMDAESEISSMVFSFMLSAGVEIYFSMFYAKVLKFKANSPIVARRLMNKSIWQFLLGSILPAIFVMISASVMARQKQMTPADIVSERVDAIASYKLEAMTEAVRRIKELKEKGVISEEEYYANLNRILEG